MTKTYGTCFQCGQPLKSPFTKCRFVPSKHSSCCDYCGVLNFKKPEEIDENGVFKGQENS